MIAFLRWFGRGALVLLLAVAVAGVVVSLRFQDWKKAALSRLEAGSKVVQTAAGPVEFAEAGSGQPLLVLHGAPGGYDQALALAGPLAEQGFRVIAPSRPGFLRTPLPTGLLFEDQADAMAALLDALGIEKVAVLGFSSGAQVAARFAARHPGRTTALVLASPITEPYVRDPALEARRLLPEAALFDLTGDMGAWRAASEAEKNPRALLERVLSRETTLGPAGRARVAADALADPAQVAFLSAYMNSLAPLSPRETGTRNDLLQLRALDPAGYEAITAPMLLLAGEVDQGLPWMNPAAIAAKRPGAVVRWVPDAGHLVWLGPEAGKVREEIRAFLARPPAAP